MVIEVKQDYTCLATLRVTSTTVNKGGGRIELQRRDPCELLDNHDNINITDEKTIDLRLSNFRSKAFAMLSRG
jgi:hypothetical protein